MLLFDPQDDLNLSGYRKYLTSQAAPLPLTAAEEELRQIKLNEVTKCTRTQRNAAKRFGLNFSIIWTFEMRFHLNTL